MDLRLTYNDYTEMLIEINKDISFVLAKIKVANMCIAGRDASYNQIEACTIAGGYYRKRLFSLIQAKLYIAIERAKLCTGDYE